MLYSYKAKNTGKDNIYRKRLELIDKMNFDYNKTAKRYNYFLAAWLGVILIKG